MTAGDVLWTPPADVRQNSRIGRYLDWLAAERGRDFAAYQDLWRWSTDQPAEFWRSIWDHFDDPHVRPAARDPRTRDHARRPLVPRRDPQLRRARPPRTRKSRTTTSS
jgi:hypothetical protein